jgi:hypothetical protein
MKRKVFLVVLMVVSISGAAILMVVTAAERDYSGIMKSIAGDIEKLKLQYPQLKDFSVSNNLNLRDLAIVYAYHTRSPEKTGGWTSGVPHPNEDGVWFYFDLHDPNSTAEVHTQPMVTVPMCLGSKNLSFLSLEGSHTTSIDGAIWKILRSYGARECDR